MHKLMRNSVVIRAINWWQTFVLDKQKEIRFWDSEPKSDYIIKEWHLSAFM